MTFKYPALLTLMIPVLLLLYFLYKNFAAQKTIAYPIRGNNIKKLASKEWSLKYLFILRGITFLFLIACLARPQTPSKETERSTKGIDIVIALDVSKSMLIEDYGKESRLTLAKETIKEFIKGRANDRIAFVMFSGESITLCPLTLDYNILEQAINSAGTNQLKDGTAIGDAIANSVGRLKKSKAKSKIIVLLTDGDSNMGSIAPLTAGSLAKGYGIKVYSIAIGKEGLVNFPTVVSFLGKQKKHYQRVNSTINPKLLKQISKETNGRFFRAEKQGSLRRIFEEINKLEKTKIETKNKIKWDENYQPLLIIALILLMVDLFLSKTKMRIIPD